MTAGISVTRRRSPPKLVNRILNAMIAVMLRSPLHGAISSQAILLSFRGCKSGKQYTFPVGYYELKGDTLIVIPLNRWWKNLRGNVPVTIWLKGRKYTGTADASQGDEAAVNALQNIIEASSNLMGVYNVPRDAQGQPDPQYTRQVAQTLALVRIRFSPTTDRTA